MDLSRILIIKPSSLGDVIQAVPVAWALRQRFPKARIDWLVMPGCAGIIEGLGAIDRVLLFDRRHYGSMWRSPRAMVSFAWFLMKLRAGRYSAVVDLQGLFRSGFLAWAAGARHRIGLSDAREGADRFYNHIVQVPRQPLSAVDRYMLAAQELGVPPDAPRRFDLAVPQARADEARHLMSERGIANGQPYVVIVPGARWSTKRWPEERFAGVAQRLSEQLGIPSVVVGGPDDRHITDRMRYMRGGRIIDLVGRTDLKVLAAVIGGAACVVTGDTGPMHLAAAMGRPVVAIFGPTNVEKTGPYGPGHLMLMDRADCARCERRTCLWEGQAQEMMCLRNISVDDVFAATRQVLEREQVVETKPVPPEADLKQRRRRSG